MLTNNSLLQLLNIKLPIIQAPMAGAAGSTLAIAVAKAGGLGSIACPTLSLNQIRSEVEAFRKECPRSPLNLNFFCHEEETLTTEREQIWKAELKKYYEEFNIDENQKVSSMQRKPFNEEVCSLMEELRPEVISFHFGLPSDELLKRVKKIGCAILSSATTAAEAKWLEEKGCDAIVAQGIEAGGHRGMFLTNDISTQLGTSTLVPLIVDAVKVPVIAAGGIVDGHGLAAAMKLGALAVQIGTAYLFTPEANISSTHKAALLSGRETALTNLFSGKPARGIMNRLMKEIGPMSLKVPPFPHAGNALAPLKEKDADAFGSLWAGQAVGLIKDSTPAKELTERIAKEAQKLN